MATAATTLLNSDRAQRRASELARPLRRSADLDPLLERIGDARLVLIGEASHGTAEYYRWRAELSRRLIAERDFSFVAVEGDWPDCYRVNCWVQGHGREQSARAVLRTFDRWPTWMWANEEVADFLNWLRAHNQATRSDVGFYGLDVYSLWESMDRIVGWVRDHAPEALENTVAAVRCFEPFGEDPQEYARALRMLPDGCHGEVAELLGDLRRLTRRQGRREERDFDALQNSEVVAGAERYYRTMVRADDSSWNVRDMHMADTLDRLLEHRGDGRAKAIVWAHNTHVGDARATDMAGAGLTNIGRIARERYGVDDVVLVGLGGYSGHVIAGRHWGAPWERMRVPSAPTTSHEHVLHELGAGQGLLVFPDDVEEGWPHQRRGHRAIGVVYEPARDPYGNWVPTVLDDRYDAFMWFDETDAVHPLHDHRRAGGTYDTEPWGT
jgi:erythromycin esterase